MTFPKTLNPGHLCDNIDAFDFALTDDEMAVVNALPQKAYYEVPEEVRDRALCGFDERLRMRSWQGFRPGVWRGALRASVDGDADECRG